MKIGFGVNTILELALRASVVVFATILGLSGRYGPNLLIIDIARLMVLTFVLAYCLNACYLISRRPNWLDDYVMITLISLGTCFTGAMMILAGSRSYFSLGFIAWFVITSSVGTLFIEYWKNKHLRGARFVVAGTGRWKIMVGCPFVADRVENPSEVDRLKNDQTLVIDLDVTTSQNWRIAAAQFASRRGRVMTVVQGYEYWRGNVLETEAGTLIEEMAEKKLWYPVAKRILDILISAILISVLLVPGLFVSLFVRLSSPGPALFVQKRVGLNGREFTIL